AAEYIAVQQLITGGKQMLVLGPSGTALQGSFLLNGINGSLDSLAIPKGVIAIENYGSTSGNLVLGGTLLNAGHIFALSTEANINHGAVTASNIVNKASGVI